MQFPSETVLADLQASGDLDEALGLYANALVSMDDRKAAADFARCYLELPDSKRHAPVLSHKALRKSVFHLIFHEHLLVDSTIETYWNIVQKFGPLNRAVCRDYLEAAPRAVSLKLGRLLLYKAEFASEDPGFVSVENFEQTVLLFFSLPKYSQAVITPEWQQQLTKLAKTTKGNASRVSNTLLELSPQVKAGSEAAKLCSLFPQLSLPESLYLLRDLAGNADAVSQIMLDDPSRVQALLEGKQSALERPTRGSKKSKFVTLDQQERDSRLETLREFNRRNFKYEYVALEDEEDEDPLEGQREGDADGKEELSQADKKLAALEDQLWLYWQSNSGLFDISARKTRDRDAMRAKLNWTNEQIEGWGRVVGSRGKARDEVSGIHHEVETYAPKMRPNDGPLEKAGNEKRDHGHKPRADEKSDNKPSSNPNHKKGPSDKRDGKKTERASDEKPFSDRKSGTRRPGDRRSDKPPTGDKNRQK